MSGFYVIGWVFVSFAFWEWVLKPVWSSLRTTQWRHLRSKDVYCSIAAVLFIIGFELFLPSFDDTFFLEKNLRELYDWYLNF